MLAGVSVDYYACLEQGRDLQLGREERWMYVYSAEPGSPSEQAMALLASWSAPDASGSAVQQDSVTSERGTERGDPGD